LVRAFTVQLLEDESAGVVGTPFSLLPDGGDVTRAKFVSRSKVKSTKCCLYAASVDCEQQVRFFLPEQRRWKKEAAG